MRERGVVAKPRLGISRDEAWNHVCEIGPRCVASLQEDLTPLDAEFKGNEAMGKSNGFTEEEEEKVAREKRLFWLLASVIKNPQALLSFLHMIDAINKCQEADMDECEQGDIINEAVKSIVKDLVALFDIFYDCHFSLAELRKMPAATFIPYQKHLNVYSDWFVKECVL